MITKKTQKTPANFICEQCDFSCSNKKDFNRHISTRKHKMIMNDNEKTQKTPIIFQCNKCNKIYKHMSGLSRHKKICLNNKVIENDETNMSLDDDNKPDIKYKRILTTMIDENKDLKNLLIEQQQYNAEQHKQYTETINNIIPKIGNTTNNTTNNQFNLNVFLNEQCKEALNIQDFMNNIQISLEDLKETSKLGYIEGMTRIFVKALQDMDITERPIHCTDYKREIVYIKDENKWEKDDDDNSKIRRSIRDIEKKNIQLLPKWQEQNPQCINMGSKESEEFMNISLNVLGEPDEDNIKKQDNKIVKNVLKEVLLEK
jgi:hypothetical protein